MGRALDLDRDLRVYGHDPRPDVEDDLLTPFNAEPRATPDRVVDAHRERTARARSMDRRQQAPVTTDVETWRAAPNRYDWLGVDTLAADVRAERADELVDEALPDYVTVQERAVLDGGTRGKATYAHRGSNPTRIRGVYVDEAVTEGREDDPRFQYPEVVSHEVGHTLDATADPETDYSASTYELRGERREEAKRLSTMMRGPFRERDGYRDTAAELAADAVAAATVAPGAARREAPGVVEWLRERLGLRVPR